MYIPPLVKNDLQIGIRDTKYEDIIVGNQKGLLQLRDALEESLNSNKIIPLKIPTPYRGEYRGIICLDDNDIEILIKEVEDKDKQFKSQKIISTLKAFTIPIVISFATGVGFYTIFNWIF